MVLPEDDDADIAPLPPMPVFGNTNNNYTSPSSPSPSNTTSNTNRPTNASISPSSATNNTSNVEDGDRAYAQPNEDGNENPSHESNDVSSNSGSSNGGDGNNNANNQSNNDKGDKGNSENTSTAVVKPRRKPKICFACKEPISGHFVRALGCIYHMECFCCHDCGNQCSAKFFPVESPTEIPETNNLIPLCEHDYFRRQDLLCCVCDGALRGSYITALGKKYHVEHFTCSLCSTVFGSDDSYYEHEDNIYCRYHYSTLYAAKCEGCKTAILKQFVEVFRGGREQQWHPECYMINKFWNVMISPTKLKVYEDYESKNEGVKDRRIEMLGEGESSTEGENPNIESTAESSKSEGESTLAVQSIEERERVSSPDPQTRDEVLTTEQDTERKAFHIWSVLCGYEEATAACISDMLQFATSSRYNEALVATARLVTKIEVLLSAIDTLVAHIDPLLSTLRGIEDSTPSQLAEETPEFLNLMEVVRNAGFTQLRKEPKTLCKKIVSFMSLLSKSRDRSVKEPGPSHELLDSVTGMAHYLKLLIRYGLSNSLRYDRAFPNGNRLAEFLDKVDTHNSIPGNPLEYLSVSSDANDKCLMCGVSTEDDCAFLDESKLWHLDCLACTRCNRPLGSCVREARYLIKEKYVVCDNCLKPDDECLDTFVVVTKLNQFIYLVKIALSRLQLVLKTYDKRDAKAAAGGRPSLDSRKSTTSSVPLSIDARKLPLQPTLLSQPIQQQTQLLVQQAPSSIQPQIEQLSQPAATSKAQPPQPPQQAQQQSTGNAETNYMTTLKDIRKLRSTHLNQRLSESSRRARRSRILDIPDSEHGLLGKNDSSTFLPASGRQGELYQQGSASGQLVGQHEKQFIAKTSTGQYLTSTAGQVAQPATVSSSKPKTASQKQSPLPPQQQSQYNSQQQDPRSQSRQGSIPKDECILDNVPSPSSEFGTISLTRDLSPGAGRSQPASPLQTPSQGGYFTGGAQSAPASGTSFSKSLKGRKFTGGPKRRRKLTIEDDPIRGNYSQLDRTTDLLKNEKSLILDDIPRIVAAEQARELRPNAYRHRHQELNADDDVTVQDVNEKRPATEKYISELTASELFVVRHIAVSLIHPMVSQWFTMDDLQDAINVRKSPSIWEKFGKAFNLNGGDRSASDDKKRSRKPGEKTGVFGVSLEQQVDQYGVDSTFGVGPVSLRIPAFVDECISAMRQMDMSVEGVFRKNGNIRRSKELAAMVDNNPDYAGMFTDENPVQLAALFKRYLRELPDCLMTFKLQKLWVNSQEIIDVDERTRVMHLACCLVPAAHRDVMEVLFYFLFWTASFSHIDEESGSKMDIHNLSTVITPNILYTRRKEGSPPDSSEGYFLAIEAVDTLIKEYDRFSKVPQEILEILFKEFPQVSSDITSKEIFARIDHYRASRKANSSNSGSGVSGSSGSSLVSSTPNSEVKDKNDIQAHYGPNISQGSQSRKGSDTAIPGGVAQQGSSLKNSSNGSATDMQPSGDVLMSSTTVGTHSNGAVLASGNGNVVYASTFSGGKKGDQGYSDTPIRVGGTSSSSSANRHVATAQSH